MRFLFWFRFRAFDGTVKTFKDSFIPFREMHLLAEVQPSHCYFGLA